MKLEKIKEFASEYGYDDVEYLGEWEGYEVYEPFFSDGEFRAIGLPLKILVKGEVIRITEEDEAFALLDIFEEEDEICLK